MNNSQFNNQQNLYTQQNSEQQYHYKMGYDNATAEFKKKDKRRKILTVVLVLFAFALGAFFASPSDADEVKTTTEKTTSSTKQTTSTTTEKPEMSKKEYKSSCEQLDFSKVVRNPDKYKGKLYKFVGEVIQCEETSAFLSDDKILTLRINVTKDEYGFWNDTVYVTYTLTAGKDRILEDDIVTVYGECDGAETYTSVLGNSVTLPAFNAEYIEFHD